LGTSCEQVENRKQEDAQICGCTDEMTHMCAMGECVDLDEFMYTYAAAEETLWNVIEGTI
jgi:hypothetical protein